MPRLYNLNTESAPKGAVYIGRGSQWGNPWRIGKDGNREQVLAKYRLYLINNPDLAEAAKRELAGKDLACWCPPKPCHGDILLALANPEKPKPEEPS